MLHVHHLLRSQPVQARMPAASQSVVKLRHELTLVSPANLSILSTRTLSSSTRNENSSLHHSLRSKRQRVFAVPVRAKTTAQRNVKNNAPSESKTAENAASSSKLPSSPPVSTSASVSSSSRFSGATSGSSSPSPSSGSRNGVPVPPPVPHLPQKPELFTKILACNRGEIAIRIMRACSELGVPSMSIYSFEDRFSPHRYKADESFLIGRGMSPVAAYLCIPEIIRLARENGVQAVHPGYGFLSENAEFAEACAKAGLVFIGPPASVLRTFGDKTAARQLAQRVGVPVVPGTPAPVSSVAEVHAFVETHGLPVIIKAAHGGGGRGMRVVRAAEELEESFKRASSEAKAAFGNGDVFVERYVEAPRHIEIQILADKQGNVVHLWERDCSVQRRHQKVVEMAPALDFPAQVRQRMAEDAVKLCKAANYLNAGTVEFLLDTHTGNHYFMEVNPRVQVEHTVTEEVTGVDIVQTQIRIAAGVTLLEMGLTQDRVRVDGFAVQCRITTEDPARNFAPDSGILSVYRSATGHGIRLDDGPGYPGAPITPQYDSLLVKVTAHAQTFEDAVAKLTRALREHRIRGVSTNIAFLLNVLQHPAFRAGAVTTRFIEQYPEVLRAKQDSRNRGEKMLRYLSHSSNTYSSEGGGCETRPMDTKP